MKIEKGENYTVEPLQKQIFANGKKVYKDMSLYEKRDFCTKQMETIPNEVKVFLNLKNTQSNLVMN